MGAVTRLLQQIAAANRLSIEKSGDMASAESIAVLLELAVDTSSNRHALMLSLGEYLTSALDGNVIDPEKLSITPI